MGSDSEGVEVSTEAVVAKKHSSEEHNAFLWTVDGDRIRSKADPRYCASISEGKVGDGSNVIMWNCGDGPLFCPKSSRHMGLAFFICSLCKMQNWLASQSF